MSNHFDYVGRNELDALIEKARMERSMMVANAIASLISGLVLGFRRVTAALKTGAASSKAHAGTDAKTAPDALAHR